MAYPYLRFYQSIGIFRDQKLGASLLVGSLDTACEVHRITDDRHFFITRLLKFTRHHLSKMQTYANLKTLMIEFLEVRLEFLDGVKQIQSRFDRP